MNKKHTHHHKSKFIPKLCSSTSTKDQQHIYLSHPHHHHHHAHSSSLSSHDEDPSSPRVGCMGQVKRNNRVIAFPTIITSTSSTPITKTHPNMKYNQNNTTTTTNTNTNANVVSVVKYHKLKRLFSSRRTLFSGLNPTTTYRVISRVQTRKPTKDRERGFGNNSQKGSLVNLEEIDPPLPVVRRVDKEEEEEMKKKKKEESSSLWKRRSGGVPLKSLQVQVIHHSQGQLVFST